MKDIVQDSGIVYFVDIPDVDDVPARLYVSNNGRWPPTPEPGDFLYDYSRATFEVYHVSGWRRVEVADLEGLVSHPNANSCTVSFSQKGLPFWKKGRHPCGFSNTMDLLLRFRESFDGRKMKVMRVAPSSCTADGEGSHRTSMSGILFGAN